MMKKQLFKPLYLSLLPLSVMSSAYADILMQWDRIPLPVELHVKQERTIFVDKNVEIGIPSQINHKIQVQSIGGVVYLTAKEPFEKNRLQLRDLETGQIILLDILATEKEDKLDNIRLVFDKSVSSNNTDKTLVESAVSSASEKNSHNSLPAPAALVRYAAQSLYAPQRTIEPLEGVSRVAMKLPKHLSTLLPNLNVEATPLESWGLNGYVVTAVKIKNKSKESVKLDPRYLQGKFYAASFQHDWLDSTGHLADTTVVYLVTEGDISQAIYPNPTRIKTKIVPHSQTQQGEK